MDRIEWHSYYKVSILLFLSKLYGVLLPKAGSNLALKSYTTIQKNIKN